MAQNAFEFALSLERLGEELTDDVILEVTKKLSMQAMRGVVMKSPVDTGRFRGNWNVSINTRDDTVTEALDKGGQGAIAKGTGIISALPPYTVVYISNNLPYARRLETGWSKQAPAGMVALTLAELEAQLR